MHERKPWIPNEFNAILTGRIALMAESGVYLNPTARSREIADALRELADPEKTPSAATLNLMLGVLNNYVGVLVDLHEDTIREQEASDASN